MWKYSRVSLWKWVNGCSKQWLETEDQEFILFSTDIYVLGFFFKVIPTKDRLEGLAAFKEKRCPHYKGEWGHTPSRKNHRILPSALLRFHCFQHIYGLSCTRQHINLYSTQETSVWPEDIRVDPGWGLCQWLQKSSVKNFLCVSATTSVETKQTTQALPIIYNMNNFKWLLLFSVQLALTKTSMTSEPIREPLKFL